MNDVAAASKIPDNILIGHKTDRLASSEDTRNFFSGIQSRRENFMTEMVSSVLDWCIQYGILPASDYEITWDDLLARSDDEKLKNSSTMATINKEQFGSGGDVPFSGEEIRVAAGFDPEEIGEPGGEGLDELDEE